MNKKTAERTYLTLGLVALGVSFYFAAQLGSLTKATQYWHKSTPNDTKQAIEYVVGFFVLLFVSQICITAASAFSDLNYKDRLK
jgi:uncharacterized membrane protein required for colicin V production